MATVRRRPKTRQRTPELGVGLAFPARRHRWTCGWLNTRGDLLLEDQLELLRRIAENGPTTATAWWYRRTQPALHHHPQARRQSPTASH